ncbi:MAG TPA: hypothetical protein VFL29_13315 [Candidatus Dormibacteraeota bacterium]|nr:hypothetical protein [Candidatus Dormibacteraeota bacterium]
MTIADPPTRQSEDYPASWDGVSWRSHDGAWRWDGSRWRPTTLRIAGRATRLGAGASTVLALMRIALYGLIAALIVNSVLAGQLGQLRNDNARLAAQAQQRQNQVNELQALVDDLRSRWIGNPALWQPSNLPANTVVRYFTVTGATQAQLITSLDNSGLCAQYSCLPDPAVPKNSPAWALEGEDQALPSSPYCYSPRTISYHWHQHIITMPQWSPEPGSVKIFLVEEWNALEGVLWTHEVGHVVVADQYLATLNQQSERLPTCQAFVNFWKNPHLWDGLDAAQNAYHARLRADCRPEIGCIPEGWMGW